MRAEVESRIHADGSLHLLAVKSFLHGLVLADFEGPDKFVLSSCHRIDRYAEILASPCTSCKDGKRIFTYFCDFHIKTFLQI